MRASFLLSIFLATGGAAQPVVILEPIDSADLVSQLPEDFKGSPAIRALVPTPTGVAYLVSQDRGPDRGLLRTGRFGEDPLFNRISEPVDPDWVDVGEDGKLAAVRMRLAGGRPIHELVRFSHDGFVESRVLIETAHEQRKLVPGGIVTAASPGQVWLAGLDGKPQRLFGSIKGPREWLEVCGLPSDTLFVGQSSVTGYWVNPYRAAIESFEVKSARKGEGARAVIGVACDLKRSVYLNLSGVKPEEGAEVLMISPIGLPQRLLLCRLPKFDRSGGHMTPSRIAVNGSDLYLLDSAGFVARYTTLLLEGAGLNPR